MERKQIFDGPGVTRPVPEGVLLGFGNPLLDLVVEVKPDFLDKYEVQLNNAILAEDKHKPMYKELMENYDVKFIAGGATQNSIRAAQWMLRTKNATSFIGSVGNDEAASILKSSCRHDGVTTHYFHSADSATGRCAALVCDKERSLVADLGAANHYKSSHIESDEIKAVIDKAQIVYCSGFPLTVPESCDTMLKICKHVASSENHGRPAKRFCLNLAAPFIIDFFEDQLNSVMKFTDIVFCNESEAETLIKKRKWDCTLEEAALRLCAYPKKNGTYARIVIFTQGSENTIVARGGEIILFPVPPIKKERILDTNGAGDAFVGGFLAKLCQGFDVPECVRAGHYASRVVIQQSGCLFPDEPDF